MEPKDPLPHPRALRQGDYRLRLPREPIPLHSDDIPQGDEAFEIKFFEDVLKADPCEEGSLIMLGHIYTRQGKYEQGLDMDQRIVRLRPDDPVAFYNLACSLSLVGRIDEAFNALEQAVRRGYEDAQHLLEDPDLARLREDERFEGFCRGMGFFGPEGKPADS